MAHTELYWLRAVDPKTGGVVKAKKVYDKYTVECLAGDWHLSERTRHASIYVDDTLYFGVPCMTPSAATP